MKRAELVLIPTPLMGHLASMVGIARLLVQRDARLTVTVLIMKHSLDSKLDMYIETLAASNMSTRIRFICLPPRDIQIFGSDKILGGLVQIQKPHVKEIVSNLVLSASSPDSPRLAGFVLDMFVTEMMDVASDFGVPSYIYFTSGAASLDFLLYMQLLHDEQNLDPTEFKDSDAEVVVASFVNPLPAKVFPSPILLKDRLPSFLEICRSFRKAKGIMVNTFRELESRAINALSDAKMIPPIYPVGPILNLEGEGHDENSEDGGHKDIMRWLDDQPPSSVVFLCFGSMGSFEMEQVKEIACALEQSGSRFLWSLRKPPPNEKMGMVSDYVDFQEVLPEGFLERTAGVGKVIGWAPQVDVLGHSAVGGFVSHCGWNSTLESLWFGTPIAAWPLYAEQQFNAFELVVELGLAEEIKLDYRKDMMTNTKTAVSAKEIERGIRSVMEHDNEKRKKVKEMSSQSKKALMDGGSSFTALGRFIQDIIDNNTP